MRHDFQRIRQQIHQNAMDALPVGEFTLRLVVKDGSEEIVREAPVRIVE